MLDSLQQDLRDACHGLWRARTIAIAAVLTLSLGIAGTTTMFALIQGVLLRPLPVHEQDRLILAWKVVPTAGSAEYPFGNAEIEAVARESRLLESAAGVTRNGAGRTVMVDSGLPVYANAAEVTGRYFDVLGVDAVLGRALGSSDDVDGAEHVIVLSNGFWHRRYGASRDIIGRQILLDDEPFRIVGVMPPDLDYPAGAEVWRTTSSVPADGPFGDAVRREVNLLGRLRPGVTVAQATSEIAALNLRLEADAPPNELRGLLPVVRRFTDVVVGDVRPVMLALFAAVALVLLISTANVANLLLMRGESRRSELAMRAALGASRARIVRQVLAESLVLAALAGAAGLAVTWWTLQALVALVPGGLPRVESVRIDAAVVLFSITIVLISAAVAGLFPALSSLRADLVSHLRNGGHTIAGGVATRGRQILVVAQVALAVTVVAAAGLLIRSVLALQAVDLGLPADRLVLIDLHVPPATYADRHRHARFLDEAIAQLESAPAVSAVTPVNLPPFTGQGWDVPRFTAEGQTRDQAAANPSLNLESVHPNYFATFQVPVVRGRIFSTADRDGAAPVAIVSEDVAASTWPGADPTGKRLKMGPPGSAEPWYTVVGVAARARYREIARSRPTLYLPAAQFQMTATMLVMRTTAPLQSVASFARNRLHIVEPDVQIMRITPFAELLDRPLARPRFNAALLGMFGVAALLLSSVGLYAVMAAYVACRDREIALRVALGATGSRVRRLVLAETARLAGMGTLLGLIGTAMATRLLTSMLFEVAPLDPLTMVGAALLLAAASALASYVPLRRATRVDAMAILRSQ
jgi:putative ABC transport system permease protein